jgi:hypothetical protein
MINSFVISTWALKIEPVGFVVFKMLLQWDAFSVYFFQIWLKRLSLKGYEMCMWGETRGSGHELTFADWNLLFLENILFYEINKYLFVIN